MKTNSWIWRFGYAEGFPEATHLSVHYLCRNFFISQRDCMVRNTRIGYNRSLYTQVEVKIHLFQLGTNKKKDHWSKKRSRASLTSFS
jgi:hypothetical protein